MDFRSLITFKTISAFPQTYLKTHAIRNKLNSNLIKTMDSRRLTEAELIRNTYIA